jgi:hypothetical protein
VQGSGLKVRIRVDFVPQVGTSIFRDSAIDWHCAALDGTIVQKRKRLLNSATGCDQLLMLGCARTVLKCCAILEKFPVPNECKSGL